MYQSINYVDGLFCIIDLVETFLQKYGRRKLRSRRTQPGDGAICVLLGRHRTVQRDVSSSRILHDSRRALAAEDARRGSSEAASISSISAHCGESALHRTDR